MKIDIISPVFCHTSDYKRLQPALQYQKEYWRKKQYSKEQCFYLSSLVDSKGIFLRGLLPRAIEYLKNENIPFEVIGGGPEKFLEYRIPSELSGLQARDYQIDAVEKIFYHKRGVIVVVTGGGKTFIAALAIKSIVGYRPKVLFLCNTIGLLRQTTTKFKEYGINNICSIGEGKKEITADVVVSTIQSFARLDVESLKDHFDMIIVDEAHHVRMFDGVWTKVLSGLNALYRIGLTATPPLNEEGVLCLEGHIGPIISEMMHPEAISRKIIVNVFLNLIKIPYNNDIAQLKNYKDVYRQGIVEDYLYNKIVVEEVKRLSDIGLTSLIYVSQINHLLKIQALLNRYEIPSSPVYGNVSGEEREKIRISLHRKEIMAVVATTAWKEGIDIPSLNNISLAAQGKDEIALLQNIGRGVRRDEGKTELILTDFFNPSQYYLVKHFGERLSLYFERGWIGKEFEKSYRQNPSPDRKL